MRFTRLHIPLLVVALGLASSSCGGDRPTSTVAVQETQGVQILYDVHHKPFPAVPLPTDSATRLDDSSPTGRFVNISEIGATFMESETRAKANQLSGFGTYMPVTVPFDGRLDVLNIMQRHCNAEITAEDASAWAKKVCSDRDFNNDVALLIDVTPDSPTYGQAVPLDFGQGNFPLVLEKRNNYFDNDPRATGQNLLLETFEEDANGNGVLDTGEDSNFDLDLGQANVLTGLAEQMADDPSFVHGVDDLVNFFEYVSNTLMFRPVVPLRQGTRYAVVLTKNLVGEDGNAIRPPYPGRHPANHAQALQPLGSILPDFGMTWDDVAFSWVFTTQNTTGDLEAIRAGLYGSGVFAQLQNEFPVSELNVLPLKDDGKGTPYMIPMSELTTVLTPLLSDLVGGSQEAMDFMVEDFSFIDYVVVGTIDGPNFLADQDGLATERYPSDDDESFRVNPTTGEISYGRTQITWWCFIPKADDAFQAPFDVVVYGHGYTSNRFEVLGFAGRMARYGVTACSSDAYGHGMDLPDDEINLAPIVEATTIKGAVYEFFTLLGYRNFAASMDMGRHRDLNNDGTRDSGGDFWTYDIFHTRDIVRQSIVDWLQVFRMMRSFDGESIWHFDTDNDGKPNLAGDFNGDGVVDFGGPTVTYGVMGGSLGGILAGIFPGIEPTVHVGAPVAGGAGLLDIGVRSKQGGVPEAVFMPFFGPLIVGEPIADSGDEIRLRFQVSDVNKRAYVPFYVTTHIAPGDLLELENLKNGHVDYTIVGANRRFRLAVPADSLSAMEKRRPLGMLEDNSNVPVTVVDSTMLGDELRITVYDGLAGPTKEIIDTWNIEALWQGARYVPGNALTAVAKGHGKKRQTPGFRQFVSLAALVLEPGDPVSYSVHYAKEPLDFSYDPLVADGTFAPGADMILIPSIGDQNVPVNTGIANARAAGIIELFEESESWGMTENDVLIRYRVVEGTERLPRHVLPNPTETTCENNADCACNGASEEEKPGCGHYGLCHGGVCGRSVLFDVDDLNHGSLQFDEPNLDPPLRLSREFGEHTVALRIPYVEDTGTHGFGTPEPTLPFDINTFMLNQVATFLITRGEIRDDACLEDSSCEFLPDRVRNSPE